MTGTLGEDGTCACAEGKILRADWTCLAMKPATNPKFPDKKECKFLFWGCTKLSVEYQKVEGKSFTNDISPQDVKQGELGDCYYMASLAAIAKQNPELIRKMIQENADGSYAVTLYKEKRSWKTLWRKPEFEPVTIQVNKEFLQWPLMHINYGAGPGDDGTQNELWPMIAEKAYAQHKGSYMKIGGGHGADAMELISGKASKTQQAEATSLAQLADWVGRGYAITAGTGNVVTNKRIKPDHAYYVVGVDRAAGTVILGNPRERGETSVVSMDDFENNFDDVSYNPLQ